MAMKCPGCGRDIREDARFCEHCGFQIPGGAQSTLTWKPAIAPPPAEKSHAALIVVAVIIAIVVILAVIFLAVVSTGSSATIVITVHSTHILYSVECQVFVGTSQIASGTLDAGHDVSYTHTYHWLSSDPTTVHVSATSTGGGLGSESDYNDITVANDGVYTVDLYV
jgi:hypothetical protein